jgi:hypothetical protein
MSSTLQRARNKARHWSRVFSRFLELCEALESRRSEPWFEAVAFLMQRAVGNLEFSEPAGGELPVEPSDSASPGAPSRFDGLDFEDAAKAAVARQGLEHDSNAEQLQILMVIASGALRAPDANRFSDPQFTPEAILEEFRVVRTAGLLEAIDSCTLLPKGAREAWGKVLKHAETMSDAVRRLRLEMATLKVVRSLYAMAIGSRRNAAVAVEPENWAWLAFTSGDACLAEGRDAAPPAR